MAVSRTTVTIPASTLEEGLCQKSAQQRAEDFVERMGRAFVGLTEDELRLVNGIHLKEHRRRR
ncbi:MAG: hypothetical protein K2X03_28330 [Bryobacteraceae bacterium]|nr:hypothetical protein [Bryobacteraceae bacterium]